MANVIKHKRGSGSDPVASDLVVGEVAIRTDVGKLFTKMDNGTVAEIAGGGSDIAINTLSSSSGTGGGSATFNGSAYRFTLSAPPSVSAQQLLVSINGVIQKPVAGTGQPSEGFSVDGTDIILGDAPATGSDFFILTFKSLGVSEPADNSVTSAKIVDGAIVNADINASAAIAGSKISPDFGSQNITTTGNINIGAGTGRLDSNGIIKTAHGTESAPSHTFINDTDNGMFRVTTNTIGFTTGGSERLRIKSDGTVGIGTTDFTSVGSPNKNFVVGSTTNAQEVATTLNVMEGTNNRRVKFFLDDDDGVFGIDSTASTGVAPFVVRMAQSEKLRIDQNGNVMIGTTTSGAVLTLDNTGQTGLSLIQTEDVGGSGAHSHILLKNTTGTVATINTVSDNLEFRVDDDTVFSNISGTEHMRIDSSGRVLIGTTSGSDALVVDGGSDAGTILTNSTNSNGNMMTFQCSGTSKFFIGSAGSFITGESGVTNQGIRSIGDMVFAAGSGATERMRLDTSGNFGTGTSSPAQIFHVKNTGAHTTWRIENDNADFLIQAGDAGADGLHFYDFDNSAYRMTVANSGNVGIGTTSPATKLHINGGTYAAPTGGNDSFTQLVISNQSAGQGAGIGLLGAGNMVTFIHFGDSDDANVGAIVYNNVVDSMQFYVNASERMNIDSSGNLNINKDNGRLRLGAHADLQIYHNGNSIMTHDGTGHFFIETTGSGEDLYLQANDDVRIRTAASENAIICNKDGSVELYHNNVKKMETTSVGVTMNDTVITNGEIRPASDNNHSIGRSNRRYITYFGVNGSINTSDKNEKNTITDSDLGLDFINKLKPISYKWNKDDGKTHYGLIAQDLEETLTSLGKTIADFGGIYKEDDSPMGLGYSELIAPLIKAVQELTAKVEALEAK